jgi:hypothetical protein
MLPNESVVRAEIATVAAPHLDFARRLLSAALAMPERAGRTTTVTLLTFRIIAGLFIKACKQYRGIIALVETGCQDDAAILTRALFETLLAMRFIGQKTLRLSYWDNRTQARIAIKETGYRLTRHFRAQLYLAHHVFQWEKHLRRLERTKGLRRPAKRLRRRTDPNAVQQEEAAIGSGWAKRLQRSMSYSGLKIVDLAYCLGPNLRRWYAGLYGELSGRVHAADIPEHLDADEATGRLAPQWHQPPATARQTLHLPSELFLACMFTFHRLMDFGTVTEMTIDGLNKELHSLEW